MDGWVEYPVPTLAEAARAAEVIFIGRVVSAEERDTVIVLVENCIKGEASGDVVVTRKYSSPGFEGKPEPEFFTFREGKQYCIFCARIGGVYEPYFRWNTLWAVARVENGLVNVSGFADERKKYWIKVEKIAEEIVRANKRK